MRITLASVVLSVCLASVSQGAFRTVSNTANFPAQYTTLQAALDACAHGDVVLVAGSETAYGDVTVKRRVTIIGPGYNPNKQSALVAKVGTLTLTAANAGGDSSGTLLLGLDVTSTVVGSNSGPQAYQRIQNVVIERCRVGSVDPLFSKNWTVKNCIITSLLRGGSLPNTCDGLLVSNNIFSGQIYTFTNNDANVTIANNIFIRSSGTIYYSGSARNIIFTNNIFYGVSPYNASNDFCTWNNNISCFNYPVTNDNFNITGTNSGGGNQVTVDPDFVGVVKQAVAFAYTQSFHLNAGSPAIGAGTDGTDVGIYGGMFPWPDGGAVPWETSPMPYIPVMEALNIQNANVRENGNLNVNIKARTND